MLPDLLTRDLDLVVCGTGAGRRSAELGRYYAGPGNRFWRTLFEVGLTPTEPGPDEAQHLLTLGIGLTDVVKDSGGSDRELPFSLADIMALRMKIMSNQPWSLCFNGKRAAKEFLRSTQVEYGVHGRLGRTTLFVAPSTSRAANGSWDIAPWQDLARHRIDYLQLFNSRMPVKLNPESIEAQLLHLPPGERARLAELLLASLDAAAADALTDTE